MTWLIYPKIEQCGFTISPKDGDIIAKSVDPDQTAMTELSDLDLQCSMLLNRPGGARIGPKNSGLDEQ